MNSLNPIRSLLATLALSITLLSSVHAENVEAVNEVMKLKAAGVNEETMLAFVKGKNLSYDLSADNIVRLRDQGLPASVLNAMLVSGTRSSAAPSTPTPTPIPVPASTSTQTAVSIPSSVPTPAPGAPGNPNSAPTPTTQVITPVLVSPPASPTLVNADVAYFQEQLSPYGQWILTEDGQRCWQPSVVVSTSGWRPYWDRGHWIWTDQGWYWSSDYPWGWAAFHYGRWHLHPHHGWVWFPDRVWAPAWVVWRTGGDYCGWAPLPPGAVYDVNAGYFLFHGLRVEAGFDFGLGLAHFGFSYVRELGEQPRRHWSEVELRGVFGRTVVVNHYSVNRVVVGGETRLQLFNHGIEPARVAAVRGRPFEQVHLHDLDTPAPGRAHEHLDHRNRTLDVYRPRFAGHR